MASAKFEITRECKFCNGSFIAKTITSIYCTPRCSKLAYAKNKKAEKVKELKIQKALKTSTDEEFISVSDAVTLYDISRDTIYRLIKKEKIRSYNLGKRLIRVCRKDLEDKFDLVVITKIRTPKKQEAKTFRLEKEDCYSIGDITVKYGVSETSVYFHIRKYGIPTRQLGKHVYAPKTEIDNLYK